MAVAHGECRFPNSFSIDRNLTFTSKIICVVLSIAVGIVSDLKFIIFSKYIFGAILHPPENQDFSITTGLWCMRLTCLWILYFAFHPESPTASISTTTFAISGLGVPAWSLHAQSSTLSALSELTLLTAFTPFTFSVVVRRTPSLRSTPQSHQYPNTWSRCIQLPFE